MRVYRRVFRGIKVVTFDESIFEKLETREYMRKYLSKFNSLECFQDKEIFIAVFNRPYRSKELENEILKRLIDTTRVNQLLEKNLKDRDELIFAMYQLLQCMEDKDMQIKDLKSKISSNVTEIENLMGYKKQIEQIQYSRVQSRNCRRKNEPGKSGRPRANIDMEKVMQMKAQGMKESHIAKHFGVARSTMNKYVKEYQKNNYI